MFVTLTEIVENNVITTSNADNKNRYTMREVTINPEYVVCVREDSNMKRMLKEGKLPVGLDDSHQFTRVYLDRGQSGIDIVVVGNPHLIEEKLIPKKKVVLNG